LLARADEVRLGGLKVDHHVHKIIKLAEAEERDPERLCEGVLQEFPAKR
jgi:hypothetical protein